MTIILIGGSLAGGVGPAPSTFRGRTLASEGVAGADPRRAAESGRGADPRLSSEGGRGADPRRAQEG